MTKEITKAVILQEIEDKFKLREYMPEKFLFGETVIPVYDLSDHLKHSQAAYIVRSVTGTGALLFTTVPANQRWLLNGYNVVFMGAGAYTVAGVFVTRRIRDPIGATTYLDLTAAQSVSYANFLANPLILDHGDQLSVNVDGYTSTQDLRLYIDYMKEEIR